MVILTTRDSSMLRFRTVRGVLPRNFPGVLNTSVKLLNTIVSINVLFLADNKVPVVGHNAQLIIVEDICHMLIQPIHLMAHGIFNLLHFLIHQLRNILFFCRYPCRRANGLLGSRAGGTHDDVNNAGSAESGGSEKAINICRNRYRAISPSVLVPQRRQGHRIGVVKGSVVGVELVG